MDLSVKLDKKGLTLVEVMIALLVALLVFFALMQTALVGIDANMRNLLRDEAVTIAEMRMNEERNRAYNQVRSDPTFPSGYDCPTGFSSGRPIERNIRNISNFDFCTNLACQQLGGSSCVANDSDNKLMTITVGWRWKGDNYYHSITTIRKRQLRKEKKDLP